MLSLYNVRTSPLVPAAAQVASECPLLSLLCRLLYCFGVQLPRYHQIWCDLARGVSSVSKGTLQGPGPSDLYLS